MLCLRAALSNPMLARACLLLPFTALLVACGDAQPPAATPVTSGTPVTTRTAVAGATATPGIAPVTAAHTLVPTMAPTFTAMPAEPTATMHIDVETLPATATPLPPDAPAPTYTPLPTYTPFPTDPPQPTYTPFPTYTAPPLAQ